MLTGDPGILADSGLRLRGLNPDIEGRDALAIDIKG